MENPPRYATTYVSLNWALLWSQKLGKFQVDNESNDSCRFTTRLRVWGADVPALLHVNCQARNLALKTYTKLEWVDLYRPVFFGFNKDTLHLPGHTLEFLYRPAPSGYNPEPILDDDDPWVIMSCKCPVDTNAITELEDKVQHIIQTGSLIDSIGGPFYCKRLERFKVLETLTLPTEERIPGQTPDGYRNSMRWVTKAQAPVINLVPLGELDRKIKDLKLRDGRDGFNITGSNPRVFKRKPKGYAELKGYDSIPVCDEPACSIKAPAHGNYFEVQLSEEENLPHQQHKHINFTTTLADDWV